MPHILLISLNTESIKKTNIFLDSALPYSQHLQYVATII